jgi:hypothetical protein
LPRRTGWSQPLPRPIILPDVPLKLETLADVRTLVHKRVPKELRGKPTWRQVAVVTAAAADGRLPAEEVAVALKLVLSHEGVAAR